jgi:WD40 repeat protein
MILKVFLTTFFLPKVELNRKSGSPVHSLAFGVDGNYLAVGGGDWNISIYSCKGSWPICRQLHTSGWIMSLKWSPDNRFLATGGNDITLGAVIYDTISWRGVDELQGIGAGEETNSLDWSADGRFLVVAGGAGVCRVVDMKTCQLIHWLNVDKYEENYDIPNEEKQSNELLNTYIGDNGTCSSEPDDNTEISDVIASAKENSVFQEFLRLHERLILYYRSQDHPKDLDCFMSCLQMLNEHVQWFGKIEDQTRKTIMDKDDGELLISILEILDQASLLIQNIFQNESHVSEWWKNSDRFNLTSRQTRRVTAWNEYCRRISPDPPTINIELLSLS